jgi:EmrB/QacA subfamily drug resistance transporter
LDLQTATPAGRLAHRWKVLAVASAAVFVLSLDLFIVNVAFPQIEKSFGGADAQTVSWVLNAYAIVLAALLVPAGRLADRRGRRRAFLIGLVVFAVGSAACGAADSVWLLVAARAVQAVGAALLLPTSLALLLPEFRPAERSLAIGVWASVSGVAAALGPPIGGLLVDANWRLVFYVNVPVSAVAFVYARRVLVESRDEQATPSDLIGALVLVAAVAMVALGLVQSASWGWSNPRTLAALTVGVAGLGGFWVRCHSHPSPVLDPALVKVRSFGFANSAALLFSAGFAAMLLSSVLFMTGIWQYSTLRAGLALSPGPLTAALFAPPAGKLAQRVGQNIIGATGIGVFACGCVWWLSQTGARPDYPTEMLPGMLITGVGVGLTLPSLASAAAAALPPTRFATGAALYSMSRQLGFALGVAILIALLGDNGLRSVGAFDNEWLFMIIVSGVASILAAAIGPRSRRHSGSLAGEASQAAIDATVATASPPREHRDDAVGPDGFALRNEGRQTSSP